ncbi:MAG TPA: hypothetical protein VGF78_05610 [Candidatus Dormibacteraeota bacterium]
MGRIRGKALEARERELKPRQHRVERHGKLTQLVVAGHLHWQPSVQILLGDCACCAGHLSNGRKCPTGQSPGKKGRRQHKASSHQGQEERRLKQPMFQVINGSNEDHACCSTVR